MMEIFKEFTFEAAHHLPGNAPEGHPYTRLHGHSFKVEVYVRGQPDAKRGWIADLGLLEQTLQPVRERLDHNYLNDVEGLETPTLENICMWIWQRLYAHIPTLHRVVVRRGSCGEGCVYQPDEP